MSAGEQPLSKSTLASQAGVPFDGAATVVWADLDGDGDLDAVGAGSTGSLAGEIAWWRNGGTFSPRIAIDNSFCGARDVHVADLDGDGDLDVAATSFFGDSESVLCDGATTHPGELAWWENTAGDATTWSAKKSITNTVEQIEAVTSVDLDCDGDLDLVAAVLASNLLSWWENDGSPGDGGWTERSIGSPDEPTSVAVADFDSDGDPDLVVTASASDEVIWWESDGTPADGGWTSRTLDDALLGARSVTAADVDSDGRPDVVAAGELADELVWYRNNGSPTGWSRHPIDTSFDGAYFVRASDVDLDGDLDVLASAEAAGEVAWYENLTGTGAAWDEHSVETGFTGAMSVDADDYDRDGDVDVLASASGIDEVALWRNESAVRTGKFGPASLVFAATALVGQVAAGDVDGDGDIDLAGADARWFENTAGDGSTWTAHDIDSAKAPDPDLFTAAIVDLDQDGHLDLVGSSQQELRWYENDGTPGDDNGGGLGSSWTRHVIEPLGTFTRLDASIGVADIDGDKDPDVYGVSPAEDRILWWENDGTPGDGTGGGLGNSWTRREVACSPATETPLQAATADVDGDGDLDIVTSSQMGTDRVSWWENDGTPSDDSCDGSTGVSWEFHGAAGLSASAVAVSDYDRDGDPDIATYNANIQAITIVKNDGGGASWSQPTAYSLFDAGLSPVVERIAFGDFDLDGDLGLTFTVGQDDKALWLENDAPTDWTGVELTASEDDISHVTVSDVDGDGDPDIVAGVTGGQRIVWFENLSAHFALATEAMPVSTIGPGGEAALLEITLSHLGESGAADIELATLDLLLEETGGDPLSDSEADALIERVELWYDSDGSEAFDAADDTQVTTLESFSLTAGRQTIALPDSDPNLALVAGASKRYFLVTEIAPGALAAPPVRFQITHLTESSSTAEDVTTDTPLVLEPAANVTSSNVGISGNCHALNLTHTGSGADPDASPDNSAGCPLGQYVQNATITLAAAPDPGFVVEGWANTDNDSTTALANAVTMPASSWTVSVTYVFPDHLTVSSETLTGTQSREACLTVTAGPAVIIQGSADIVFRASQSIALGNGFEVEAGAQFGADSALPANCL